MIGFSQMPEEGGLAYLWHQITDAALIRRSLNWHAVVEKERKEDRNALARIAAGMCPGRGTCTSSS